MKKIIIAIDGYAGCGKSTTAKSVAKHLDYIFIDTGAMYRAVTLYFLLNQIPLNQEPSDALMNEIKISFELVDNQQNVFLNNLNVNEIIRSKEVSDNVSQVSSLKTVRKHLVAQQQRMGLQKGIVMDGRDIGSVVFPNAELKIFMQATMEARVKRRLSELSGTNFGINEQEIRKNLESRDFLDTTRTESPLRKADDAFVIDTTNLTIEQQVQQVLALAYEKIHS